MPCCYLTAKGKPCPIEPDRLIDGQWVCHVHDPNGLAAKNREGMKQDRLERKRLKAERKGRHSDNA